MEGYINNYDKKRRIIKKYNSTSFIYDKRYREIQKEKYKILFDNYRINEKLILDMGCGTGLLFEYIVQFFLDTQETRFNYAAIDISWNMLLEFKAKLIKMKLKKNFVDLILSDIEYLPFRENVFSSVFSLTSFQNLPNINNGIEELYKVSKHEADFKFSILKKNRRIEELIEQLKPLIKNLDIIRKENLEDIIIQGKIRKL